ncbi:hypothetical protein ABIB57_003631 [Devosia sp. UYZn731]
MALEQSRRYCPEDDRMVLAEKPATNHLIHLVLTIFTGGLWGIIWILIAMNNAANKYRCPSCGSVTKRNPPRGWKPRARRRQEEDFFED